MPWRLPSARWWKSWGAVTTTTSISIFLLFLGDGVQIPIVRGLRSTILYPASVIDSYLAEIRGMREENAALRLELARARVDAQRFQEIARQNARLTRLVGFEAEGVDTLVAAKVVGRALNGSADWSHLTVRADVPFYLRNRPLIAIAPEGLVGVVAEGSLGFYVVRSLASSKVAVHVVDSRSRVAGIVRAHGGTGVTRLLNVPAQEDVAPGDTLVTSGFGITYPSGIPVAEVVEVEISGDGLVKLVRVEPFVRFSRLEELYLAPGVGGSE